MELYYDFLGIYGTRNQKIEDASKLMEEHVASGYFEVPEVAALCKEYNVVIMFQVEQDDGLCESFVINNLGETAIHLFFSMDKLYEIQQELRNKGLNQVFTQEQITYAYEHMNEMGLSEQEFIDDNIGEFMLDDYERKKEQARNNLIDYYIKKTA